MTTWAVSSGLGMSNVNAVVWFMFVSLPIVVLMG